MRAMSSSGASASSASEARRSVTTRPASPLAAAGAAEPEARRCDRHRWGFVFFFLARVSLRSQWIPKPSSNAPGQNRYQHVNAL